MTTCTHASAGCDYPASECAMSKQPAALHYAEVLEGFYLGLGRLDATGAAAELRRLHAENADFRVTCDHLISENAKLIGMIVRLKEQRDELRRARQVLGLERIKLQSQCDDLLEFARGISDGVIVKELMTNEGLAEVFLRWQKSARVAIAKAEGKA